MFGIDYICEGKLVSKGKLICPNCGRKSSEMKRGIFYSLNCPCGRNFEVDEDSLKFTRRYTKGFAFLIGFILILTIVSATNNYIYNQLETTVESQIKQSEIINYQVTKKLIEPGLFKNRILIVENGSETKTLTYVTSEEYYLFEVGDDIWLRVYEGEVEEISDRNEWK